MSQPKSLLLVGATGFMIKNTHVLLRVLTQAFSGGTVLDRLLHSLHENIRTLTITALVRTESQSETLERNGIRSIVLEGGLDDSSGLTHLASQHDIVVNAATGFHAASAKAFITGLAERKKSVSMDVFYIHLSGTSNLAVGDVTGLGGERRTFSDKDEDIYAHEAGVDACQPYAQRTADLAVIETSETLGVRAYIIMPPTVWGQGTGHFHRVSHQIPMLIRQALKAGRVEYVAPGSSRLGHVHVVDLASLFELVVARAIADPALPSGRNGYFFANTGSHSWLEVSEAIAKAGHELGVFRSMETVALSLSEAAPKFMGGDETRTEQTLASTSSTRPEKAFDIGWQPQKEKDWASSIPDAIKTIILE